ncbi:MAG TPA: hypothetical protein VGL91_06030 [Acidobacteriota bacterium]|jgi:hypothetical protein
MVTSCSPVPYQSCDDAKEGFGRNHIPNAKRDSIKAMATLDRWRLAESAYIPSVFGLFT